MNRIIMLSIFSSAKFFKSCGLSCFLSQLTSEVSTEHALNCHGGSRTKPIVCVCWCCGGGKLLAATARVMCVRALSCRYSSTESARSQSQNLYNRQNCEKIQSSNVQRFVLFFSLVIEEVCLDVVKAVKVLERVAPSVIARYFVTTPRASRSQPSVV